jgi:hypothetical protein
MAADAKEIVYRAAFETLSPKRLRQLDDEAGADFEKYVHGLLRHVRQMPDGEREADDSAFVKGRDGHVDTAATLRHIAKTAKE